MNKKIAVYISCTILVAVFVFMFAFCAFFPRTYESDHSELRAFPTVTLDSVLSGKFFSEFSAWFTDTVFYRDNFVDINAVFRGFFGFVPEEQIFISDTPSTDTNGDLIYNDEFEDDWVPDDWEDDEIDDTTEPVTPPPATSPSTTTPPSTTSPAVTSGPDVSGDGDTSPITTGPVTDPPVTDPPATTPPVTTIPEISQGPVAEEMAGDILIMGTRAMEIYFGNASCAEDFATILNSFSAKVGSGVRVYSMMIPKSCAMYLGDSKTSYAKYVTRSTRDLNAHKAALSGVTYIPAYDVLLPHKNEEIYYRTDHHWTGLGAYYAAEEFAKIAGVDFMPLSSYTKNVRPGYVGTMYKYTQYSPTLLNNPEDFVTYIPSTPYTITKYNSKFANGKARDSLYYSVPDSKRSSWYSTYLGSDTYSFNIKSGTCQNGRKLLLVKDSYGNALSPYLVNSFEEIYIVDARYFELSLVPFVQANGITDVLFAESAFSAVGKSYRNSVRALVG